MSDDVWVRSSSSTDRDGRTQLHHAALNDDVTSVKSLLAKGASPDAQDKEGFAPLHFAAQELAVGAAAALLEGGASVDVENAFGNTPLWTAVFSSKGAGDLIALLRAHGADPLHANAYGGSPVGAARLIANYDVRQFFADVPNVVGDVS